MNFVRSVFLVRELSGGLERFCTEGTLDNIKKALIADAAPLLLCRDGNDMPTDADAQVVRLVLKDFDTPDHAFSSDTTEPGKQTLACIRNLVFANQHASDTFAHCVFMGTLLQARLAQDFCIAALMDSLSTKNCISLYSLATSCGCDMLRANAESLTLKQFSQAAIEDYDGLAVLEEDVLMQFLCSDALTVDCELDVFKALASWVEHDLPSRISKFAVKMGRAVRFGELSIADMTYMMDQNPLVSLDQEAVQLVTFGILQTYAGTNFDNPLGRISISKPRICQRKPNPGALIQDIQPTTIPTSWTFSATLRSLCPDLAATLLPDRQTDKQPIDPADKENAVFNTVDTNTTGKQQQNCKVEGPIAGSISGLALEMIMSPSNKAKSSRPISAASNQGGDSPRPALQSARQLCW